MMILCLTWLGVILAVVGLLLMLLLVLLHSSSYFERWLECTVNKRLQIKLYCYQIV